MSPTPLNLGKRLCWALLVLLHRVGLAGLVGRLANRFRMSGEAPFVRRRRCGNLQILVYHRVTPEQDCYLPSTPLEVFQAHMECLARRFQVLDLIEAVDALRNDTVPDNAVVITFDDGYRDNFDFAYPILSALSLPATIFLATGVIGTHDILWHDRVFRMFGETTVPQLEELGPDKYCSWLGNPAQRRSARDHVLARFKRLDPQTRNQRIAELADKLLVPDTAPSERLMLSWDEVREMKRGGVSFGAHTVSHAVLSAVSPAEGEREIVESKRVIERLLQAEVTAFAYPNGRRGDFDADTKSVLRATGFACAVTTIPGGNSCAPHPWDPFELCRAVVDESDPVAFLSRMNAYRFLT